MVHLPDENELIDKRTESGILPHENYGAESSRKLRGQKSTELAPKFPTLVSMTPNSDSSILEKFPSNGTSTLHKVLCNASAQSTGHRVWGDLGTSIERHIMDTSSLFPHVSLFRKQNFISSQLKISSSLPVDQNDSSHSFVSSLELPTDCKQCECFPMARGYYSSGEFSGSISEYIRTVLSTRAAQGN
jgi:hypothetical protein